MGENAVNRDKASDTTSEVLLTDACDRATRYREALERFEPWMVKPCREIAERYQREAHFGPPCDQGTKFAFYEQWKKITAAIQAATEALEAIRDGGGRCTETDDCPYCIATRALEADHE